MLNNYCSSVAECSNFYPNTPGGTTCHSFPEDEGLAKECKSKIGKDIELNTLVCSDHFNQEDFKSLSQNRNQALLPKTSSLLFPNDSDKLKIGLGRRKVNNRYQLPDTNLFHLPLDVWENLFDYVSLNDIITLSSVCKHLQEIVQTIKRSFVFSHCYSLNIDCLLNYTLSTTCKSLNLNHCYWLKPNEIIEIISKTKLEHLHVVECNINEECIKAICDLSLLSLSITYNEEWQHYLTNDNVVFYFHIFKTLKRFKIFLKKTFLVKNNIIFEIYAMLICHCKQLEYLKMFDCASRPYFNDQLSDYGPKPKFPLIPLQDTPLPILKTLIINISNECFKPYFKRFIEVILKNKVIPLEYVDFGYLTGYLFQNNILQDQPIRWDKSPLIISCAEWLPGEDCNIWLDFTQVQNLFNQSIYKKIIIKNNNINGFSELAQRIVKTSKFTLKEIYINYNEISKDCDEFLVGLLHIAINCPQITVLDITDNGELHDIDYATFQKHEAIMNAFSNLKSLKKLIISPQLLHCNMFIDSNGKKCIRAIPFWKVTEGCKQLMEIRIVCIYNNFSFTLYSEDKHIIHPDSLYAIAQCAKLRVLHLVNFRIKGISLAGAIITKITKSCEQLQELLIFNLKPFHDKWLEKYLCFANNLKIISISEIGTLNITKKFIANLSLCKKIEKLHVDDISVKPEECENLANVFLKLTNLRAVAFGQRGKRSTDEAMNLLLNRIAKERPAFAYCLSEYEIVILKSIPMVHFDVINLIKDMLY